MSEFITGDAFEDGIVPREAPSPRTGTPPVKLSREEFTRRFLSQFIDPAFDGLGDELQRVAAAAWDGYAASRKSPRTHKAGAGFADPDYDLADDWRAAKAAVDAAQARHDDPGLQPRVLVISGAARNEHTCPGELSKSARLAQMGREAIEKAGIAVDFLDLSLLSAEYGRNIHPCKTCFSTAAPLCHWPCSCYPNYALGQTQDWMNDIYPLWAAAHGVFIVTPVNWYQVSSPLKLMMDRLVCADGGNPDPSSTQGKEPKLAKQMELDGWSYPQHLKGRLFAVISHGDVEGAEGVRRSVSDWLAFMGLEPAGNMAELDRYIGYWEPYATSHEALDADLPLQGEVRNAAATLAEAVLAQRAGRRSEAGAELHRPRRK
ncbi:MAG TPA: flavodoxin family protein [Devosia sp.]|nr:flavodoxin family protein [Devosia sp.]